MDKLKKVLKITGIVLAGMAVLVAALGFGLSRYGEWKFNNDIKKLEAEANRPYLVDTYGGKTPQETLQLFISAVEREDFELASKYFILSKQEEWKAALVGAKEANKLSVLLKPVKEANETIKKEEPIWETKNSYVYANEENIFFEFVKYPNVWKIREI